MEIADMKLDHHRVKLPKGLIAVFGLLFWPSKYKKLEWKKKLGRKS